MIRGLVVQHGEVSTHFCYNNDSTGTIGGTL